LEFDDFFGEYFVALSIEDWIAPKMLLISFDTGNCHNTRAYHDGEENG